MSHVDDIPQAPVQMDGAERVGKRLLVGPEHGWTESAMRVFTVGAEGHTPRHAHGWEHVNYVVRGSGSLEADGERHELAAGSVAFVPPHTEHQFRADRGEEIEFICIVPRRGEK